MSSASLLKKVVSIRGGSSCRANARLIKRPQAVKAESGSNPRSAQDGEGGVEDVLFSDTGVVAV